MPEPEPDPRPVGGEAAVLCSVRGIATFVAPTSVITALLVYFGWVWTDALSRYLGLDESLFPFATRDYVLRSLTPAFLPLIALLVAILVAQWAHSELLHRVESGLPAIVPRAIAGAGGVLVVVSLLTVLIRLDRGNNAVTPVGLLVGVILLGFAASVAAARRRAGTDRLPPTAASTTRLVVVLLLLTITLFWEVSNYASWTGHRAGVRLIENLDCRPDAVVYSEQRLHLGGEGVTEDVLHDPDFFRYSGMKLLLHSGGRYFLLSADWGNDPRTFVLPDAATQRLEFVRPPDPC